GHGEQGHRDPLPGGEQHVELPLVPVGADLGGQVEQLVGGVAHGGHDDGDLVAGAVGLHDALRHASDRVDVGHGGAAVLLDEKGHRGVPNREVGGTGGADALVSAAKSNPVGSVGDPT